MKLKIKVKSVDKTKPEIDGLKPGHSDPDVAAITKVLQGYLDGVKKSPSICPGILPSNLELLRQQYQNHTHTGYCGGVTGSVLGGLQTVGVVDYQSPIVCGGPLSWNL